MPIPALVLSNIVVLSIEGGGSVNDRSYTVTLRAEANDQRYGPTSIIQSSDLPSYGDFYQYTPTGETTVTGWDLMSVLIRKRAKLETIEHSKTRWLITLEYGKEQDGPTDAESGEIATNPLQEKPEVSGSFIEYLRAIDKDVDDKPIEASSKEPFDPPVEIEDGVLEIVVAKNYGTIDLTALANIRGKVNSDAIFGGAVAAGLARCKGFQIAQKWHNNSPYYRITTTIQIKDSWQVKKLDQGYFEWDETTFESPLQLRILDKDHTPRQSPSLLDGNGKRLPRTGGPPPAPVYRTFTVYKSTAFAPLALPPLPAYTPPTPPGP